MLVLTRKLGESIAIDDHIKIRVVQIKGKQVRLGIEAQKTLKFIEKKFIWLFRIRIINLFRSVQTRLKISVNF